MKMEEKRNEAMGSQEEEDGHSNKKPFSPIGEYLFFHKAIRVELEKLHADVMSVGEEGEGASFQAVLDRFQSLHIIYTTHTDTMDEVILPALDCRVKNVARTYSLEHEEESKLFDQIFQLLNALLEHREDEHAPMRLRQELASCTKAIQTVLCQHMYKEEKQVFPLLMQHFSFEEQSGLVWQALCGIPVYLLEQLLPWIASSLTEVEQKEMITGISEIAPREELQQVILTWLESVGIFSQSTEVMEVRLPNFRPSAMAGAKYRALVVTQEEEKGTKADSKVSVGYRKSHNKRSHDIFDAPKSEDAYKLSRAPIDDLVFWHSAIGKELKELAEDVKGLDFSAQLHFSTLNRRFQFMAEVCKFHRVAEYEVIFPTICLITEGKFTFGSECSNYLQQFDYVLQSLEGIISGTLLKAPDLFRKLSDQANSIADCVHGHLQHVEAMVLPLLREHCSHEVQQKLLYESLKVMPLKVLERFFPWLISSQNEEEYKSMLENLRMAACVVDDIALFNLLSGWACKGHMHIATNSMEFRCISAERWEGFPIKKLKSSKMNSNSICSTTFHSSRCELQTESHHEEHKIATKKSFHVYSVNSSGGDYLGFQSSLESSKNNPKFSRPVSKPIDTIFQFHKAISKDLEYLDTHSAKLWDCDDDFLKQFTKRLYLLRGFYHAHSTAEDDIVFPALESKEALHNVSHSYSIDHKQEEELFKDIADTLLELSLVHERIRESMLNGSSEDSSFFEGRILKQQLASKLQGMCKAIHISLDQHTAREELELWPLFDSHFSLEEQRKIVGRIIGMTGAEALQTMLPWVITALPQEEQISLMDTWRQVARNTMFDTWLISWWKDFPLGSSSSSRRDTPTPPPGLLPEPGSLECLQMVLDYLSTSVSKPPNNVYGGSNETENDVSKDIIPEHYWTDNSVGLKESEGWERTYFSSEGVHLSNAYHTLGMHAAGKEELNTDCGNVASIRFEPGWEQIFHMNQKELEAAIRKVSCDTSLDPRKKAYLMQNLMTSRWIVSQHHQNTQFIRQEIESSEIPGKSASYLDPEKGIYGCKHYKRNCKIRASCCGILYACRFCHDKVSDHSMDRQATKEMMCMKCLEIQPVAKYCSTPSCENFCMARYYCDICKLFDDDEKRQIYHCPFCNLCRVGKGLGVDYFHCMTCNACMYKTLSVHRCREKGLESDCPICSDFLFTSKEPVKALTCGHFMHSTCFQAYTSSHYTCPICSKSLGDMTDYFNRLDTLLANEELPEEYRDKQQDILCNDCEWKSKANFHWQHHKCGKCGSYNTRVI